MPNWLPVVATLVIAVLAVLTNAAVNSRIRFAPTAEAATRDLKLLAFRIAVCRARRLLGEGRALAGTGY